MSIFAKRLKLLRLSHNLSQAALGELIGFKEASISQYETGRRTPDLQTLTRIANALQTTTDYLLGLTDITLPPDLIDEALRGDPILIDFWDKLRRRKDLQLFFRQVSSTDPKVIMQTIRIMQAIANADDEADK